MNKTMKKVYETPFTTHVRVEMESRLCAGSATVTNPNNANGHIDEHGVGNTYDFFTTDQTDNDKNKWNTDPTLWGRFPVMYKNQV